VRFSISIIVLVFSNILVSLLILPSNSCVVSVNGKKKYNNMKILLMD
jgi:hypothetical protein